MFTVVVAVAVVARVTDLGSRNNVCPAGPEPRLALRRQVHLERVRAVDMPVGPAHAPVREGARGGLGRARRVDRGGLVVHRSHALAVERPAALDALHFLAAPAHARGRGVRTRELAVEFSGRTCHTQYQDPPGQDPTSPRTCPPCTAQAGRIAGKYAAPPSWWAGSRLRRSPMDLR